ncbi:MAG TPA: cellulase family glycosylhydrolase, partial [Candidatus Methylacidiphilales bacterium]
AAYAQYAGAVAGHFKGKGVIWEVWNEPNWAMFWRSPGRKLKPGTNIPDYAGRSDAGDHEHYAKMALAATKAIRAADPDAVVLGPAYGGAPQADFVDIMGKSGVIPLWSGFSIHPYPHGAPEESLSRDFYDPTLKMIQPYFTADRQVPIVVTEAGYSNAWAEIDEKTEGQYLARTYLYNLLCGIPLTVWYDFHDDGNSVKDQEQCFGITHHDYHAGAPNVYDPKAAYFAAATYADQLKNSLFKQRVKTDQDTDYLLEFTTQSDPTSWAKSTFVAWTTAPDAHAIQIHAPRGTYQLTSFDGTTKSTVSCTDGVIPVTLDGGPQYLKAQ